MGELGIGQSVTRFEDPRLLRGRGNCIIACTRSSPAAPATATRPKM